ncbi:hypothetical protein DFH08DRAFT_1079253 [Mycena albidolilacea]|uniref:Uncharacterized protein n=1 Tax=Mycena albidolilacea TaxID=1033008 RepID=A0AAD7ES19_9AGAR|nr:hypothetical protein DFH08DRAFT_1079253 [Mycena albidolilacea]
MSDNSLPDEIISEILSPALKVSDEVFSDTSDVSPFAKYSESTSAYLLVCKSWLRVATPLLYNVVILRSKAQAKALSVALSGNEQLGQFIKKLRVEGGYGPPMHTILKCSPNISDLFLSLAIYSSDNTSGLCKGLSLINPTRLILRDSEGRKSLVNKMVSQLLDALSKSIPKWDRLRVFDCPFTMQPFRTETVILPLAQGNRLHTLTLPNIHGLVWAHAVFKGCPLKVIHIKRPVENWEERYLPETDPVLMSLLKFERWAPPKVQESAVDLPFIAPSLNPSFIPMAGAPAEVYDVILARILYFAMAVPHRLPLLLVSKTFHRLGLPHHYTHVVLRQLMHISQFGSIILNNPSVGPHVRSLALKYWDWHDEEDESSVDDRADAMLTILSQTSGALRITGEALSMTSMSYHMAASISWDGFAAMARCSGHTLREFSVKIDSTTHPSAAVFADLVALRILEWKCGASFLLTEIPQDGFPNLEDLQISSADESFLTALSLMDLGSLRRVNLWESGINVDAFLDAHGPKLTELSLSHSNLRTSKDKIIEVCSNLRSMTIRSLPYNRDKPPEAIHFSSPHAVVASLTKITLDVSYFSKIPKDEMAAWDRFFTDFQLESFPNLREMEVKCCVWPTSEREIAKSCWVRWAEILLKRNISLADKDGTKWRPRLKVK